MKNDIKEKLKIQLTMFNQIHKNMDIVYHNYAKKSGLSDAAFWILYSLTENAQTFTQRELCNEWSFPPQTVNSALKELEKQNIICLAAVPGNKKNKWIQLTSEGRLLVSRVIVPLMQMECDSFSVLTEEECESMLSFMQKYAADLCTRIGTREV